MKKRRVIHRVCIVTILLGMVGMGMMLPGVLEKFSDSNVADSSVVESDAGEQGNENAAYTPDVD